MRFARKHWKEGNKWNGRQIKNAFQTAVALADWDSMKGLANGQVNDSIRCSYLEPRHFETVARASSQFDRYLDMVRREDATRAMADEIRRDDITIGMLQRPKAPSSKSKGKAKRSKAVSESEESSETSDQENDEDSTPSSVSGEESGSEINEAPVKSSNKRSTKSHDKSKSHKKRNKDELM
jgi:hypothetical protein